VIEHPANGDVLPEPDDDELHLSLESPEEAMAALTREEVRRRAEAPLPRSLLDFLR
jgi:hypothetical protein